MQSIKGQEQITTVCLNPECVDPNNRFVSCSDAHCTQDQCKQWCYVIQQLFVANKQLLNNLKRDDKGLLFDFSCNPIDSLKRLHSLKQLNWKYTLSTIFNQIRQHFIACLQLCQNHIIQSIDKSMNHTKLYEDIQNIVSNQNNIEQKSVSLTDLLANSKIPNQSILMFNPESIKSIISSISQSFITLQDQFIIINASKPKQSQQDKINKSKSTVNIEQEILQFQLWMREDVDNPYAKIQNLASTFNLPPSVYTTESLNTKLDCFLCSKNITAKNDSNKRNTKKVVAKLLIEHLIKNHWSQVFQNYRKKITKTTLKEYSMSQVIEQIVKQKIRRVEIIDRENAGTYAADQNGQFVLEVVSEKNISLATGNYVVAKSVAKDAADIVMSFIIKDLLNIKNLSVRLMTNDHFGGVIQQICQTENYDFKVISRIKK